MTTRKRTAAKEESPNLSTADVSHADASGTARHKSGPEVDPNAGLGGSYKRDPVTGKRKLISRTIGCCG